MVFPYLAAGLLALAASVLRGQHRGVRRDEFVAGTAVLDLARIQDRAACEWPHRYPEATVCVLVNGPRAGRDGEPTGAMAGRALRWGGLLEAGS